MYYSDKKVEVLKEGNRTDVSIKSKGLGYFIKLVGDKITEAYTTSLGRKKSCDAKPILKQYNMENLLN